MNRAYFIIALLFAVRAMGQTTQPSIAIGVDVEDGKKMVHATVTVAGKARENVILQYFVQRTFGNLQIGEDTTLDDGTSAVAFPTDLPGSADGKLHVIVRIKAPPPLAGVSTTGEFPADLLAPAIAEEFPRALWAPNAPIALVVCIFVLLAGVWSSYAFVVSRIWLIRKGAKS